MRRAFMAALILAAGSQCGSALDMEPQLDTLEQLRIRLQTCGGSELNLGLGQEVTLRLAFKADGTLLGPPRLTYVKGAPNAAMRAALVAIAQKAMERCTPVTLTKGFGGAIAGRTFTLRFVGSRLMPLT